MSIVHRLKGYLDNHHIQYENIPHRESHTALEMVHALKVLEKDLATVVKSLIVKVRDGFVMIALAASDKVDLTQLKAVMQTRPIRLATEEECQALFPDCDLGNLPPFGKLYGLRVYADQALTQNEEIIVPSGTCRGAIKMRYGDFERLARPTVVPLRQLPVQGGRIMVKNLGVIERWIRVMLGSALLTAAIVMEWPVAGKVLVAGIGVVAFVTGVAQYCPAWRLLGINTCSRTTKG